MTEFQLTKEDWLKAEPGDCCNCVFGIAIKRIEGKDAIVLPMGQNLDEEDGYGRRVEVSYIVPIDQPGSTKSIQPRITANEAACDFDLLECLFEFVEEVREEVLIPHKLSMYEKYKDQVWTLE